MLMGEDKKKKKKKDFKYRRLLVLEISFFYQVVRTNVMLDTCEIPFVNEWRLNGTMTFQENN